MPLIIVRPFEALESGVDGKRYSLFVNSIG
jgi:hypothetical protein